MKVDGKVVLMATAEKQDIRRYHCWTFVLNTTTANPDDFLNQLVTMKYIAYHRIADSIVGYVYTVEKKSIRQMSKTIPDATWSALESFASCVAYCTELSKRTLTETGKAPKQGYRRDPLESVLKKRKEMDTECEEKIGVMRARLNKCEEERQVCERELRLVSTELNATTIEVDRLLGVEMQLGETNEKMVVLAGVEEKLEQANEKIALMTEESSTTAKNVMDLVQSYFQRDARTGNHDLSFALRSIYQLQPPLRTDARFVGSSSREGLGKALVKAKLHYHPDKQGVGNHWRMSVCTEITKFLNGVQKQFDKNGRGWK
jgi:hypothetical protein